MTIDESNKRIIELLAAGKTVKEIAAELHMKKRTVNDRIEMMKKKNESATITELVVNVLGLNVAGSR